MSQGTRKITYASLANPGQNAPEFSAATTWGELKAEFPKIEQASIGMKAWLKADASNPKGSHLASNSDKLPEGDVVIYFLVEKNDSGTK